MMFSSLSKPSESFFHLSNFFHLSKPARTFRGLQTVPRSSGTKAQTLEARVLTWWEGSSQLLFYSPNQYCGLDKGYIARGGGQTCG